jgi:hypothetical protein
LEHDARYSTCSLYLAISSLLALTVCLFTHDRFIAHDTAKEGRTTTLNMKTVSLF